MKYLKHSRNRFFLFLGIAIVGAIILATGLLTISNNNQVTSKNNSINNNNKIMFGYEFKSHADINGDETYFEYVGLSNPSENIQVTVFYVEDSEVARIFIEDHMTMFKSVFEPKRVDYPGQYSKTIECPPEYKPKYFERNITGGEFKYFLGYANSNKVAGACSDDLIAYRHVYGMLNCESIHKIVKIEYFAGLDSDSIDKFIDKISCKDI